MFFLRIDKKNLPFGWKLVMLISRDTRKDNVVLWQHNLDIFKVYTNNLLVQNLRKFI